MATKKEPRHVKITRLREYLEDPDNDFPSRTEMALNILGYSKTQNLYRILTPKELNDLEAKAVEERKKRSSRSRANLYDVLIKLGKAGDVQAIKEYLNRTEGPVEQKSKVELTGKDGGPIEYSDLERAKRLAAILDAARTRRDRQPAGDE